MQVFSLSKRNLRNITSGNEGNSSPSILVSLFESAVLHLTSLLLLLLSNSANKLTPFVMDGNWRFPKDKNEVKKNGDRNGPM